LAARAAPIPDLESLIEIALWNAIARKADQPLYKLLGAAQERIPTGLRPNCKVMVILLARPPTYMLCWV